MELQLVLKHVKIPTIILFSFIGLFVLWVFIKFNPADNSWFPKCPFYVTTSLYCPGCGSQRAIHAILHGNFSKALGHNILILVPPFILVYDGIIKMINHYFDKSLKNWLHSSRITFSILIMVLLFWILRNIDYYPFTILAP